MISHYSGLYIISDSNNIIKVTSPQDYPEVLNEEVPRFNWIGSTIGLVDDKYYAVDNSGKLVIFDLSEAKVTIEEEKFHN